MADAVAQYGFHRLQQAGPLVRAKGMRGAFRMDARREQCFVGIDVAYTGQEGLIEQQGFDESARSRRKKSAGRCETAGAGTGVRSKGASLRAPTKDGY